MAFKYTKLNPKNPRSNQGPGTLRISEINL